MKLALLFVIFISLSFGGPHASYDMAAPEGFLWYQESLNAKDPEKNTIDAPSPSPMTAKEKNEALTKAFDDAVHEAIEEPSLENVKKAKDLQALILNRSETFSKVWTLATLLDAKNYDAGTNANPKHLRLRETEKALERQEVFKGVSKNYGIFFIWKEECKYCHAFLPIVKAFATTHGFELIAVSRTGGKIPGVKSLKDNGIIDKINTENIYPSVFLARFKAGINSRSNTNEIYPISWGMSAMSELEENAVKVIQHFKGKEK